MVGSIAGSAVDVLLQNEEISLIRNFKNDFDKLKDSLEMIRDFLEDAEEKQVTDASVKYWLIRLEALAFEAENVLDEVNYEVHRRKMEPENKLKKKVRALFSTRKLGLEIRSINEKLKSINQKATDFGFQRQLRYHSNLTLVERETASNPDPVVVGRDDYVSSIVEILTTHNEQEVFSVLPIVGMGGVGKTTVAKLVFHDKKIEAHFEKRIWVYVGVSFDETNLLKKILESLSESSYDDFKTEEALLRKLREKLEAKKYLLVLDDVWMEDTQKWNDFVNSLSSITSVKGSEIIVTTRNEKVALVVGTIHIQELRGLSDEDCWSIIKIKAFRIGYVIPLEFEAIGKKIANRCEGLPLAAEVIGGLLRFRPIEDWYKIEKTGLSNLGRDGDTMSKILKLSFDNLPSRSLKKCFAFCANLPRGYQIQKNMLIHLWMAEGFLQSDDMNTLGDKYFGHLLHNSLLQIGAQFPDGGIAYYTMHNLVFDMAVSVLNEFGTVQCIYTKSITDIPKKNARNMRSLIFVGRIFDDNILSDFKCLRGLVLIGYDNIKLPKIEHLIHLRYLDIFATSIGCSPKLIGNLYLLQSFRARIASKELSGALKKLINLRHVYVEGTEETRAETQLGRKLIASPCLQYLKLPCCPKPTYATSHFPNLKTLYMGRMSSSLLENLLVNITSLTELQFQHLPELVCLPEVFFDNNQNLAYLKICLCRKIDLPPRFGVSLREVEIDCCLEQEKFPENMHCLDKLLLRGCPNITSIPYESDDGSPSLRELKISDCGRLTELPTDLLESCSSSLESVCLKRLPSLRNMGMVIDCLQKMRRLTSLQVDLNHLATDDFPTEIVGSFESLRELWITCGMEMWHRIQDLLQHLNALWKLTLCHIEMEAVPEWLEKLSFLRELELSSCPNLKSLHSKQALRHLTRLKVFSCPLLNLRRDDDNSEWHKVSHIAHVDHWGHQNQVFPEQVKLRGPAIQKGQTKPTDISDQASTSWSKSNEIKSLKSENKKLNAGMFDLKSENEKLKMGMFDLKSENEKLKAGMFDLESKNEKLKTAIGGYQQLWKH